MRERERVLQAFELMEKNAGGLRKGTWTQEEDNLLRACIHQYGEGKWHLVPQRAGLKRCRKSCRMRWLNYLKPNINRGSFTDDEVDMIQRFHKLLGNRWSLIAGRLPGRTANDVKNFWHTNMRNRKKEESHHRETKAVKEVNVVEETAEEVVKHLVVIKPQPQSFSKNSPWLRKNNNDDGGDKKLIFSASDGGGVINNDDDDAEGRTSCGGRMKEGIAEPLCATADFMQRDSYQSGEWWESLLNKEEVEEDDGGQVGNFTMMDFWDDEDRRLSENGRSICGGPGWMRTF